MSAFVIQVMATAFAMASLATLAPNASAEPSKPVRIIEITKESADRSARAISAAKSPFIGAPPPGQRVHPAEDWRNARAQAPEGDMVVARQGDKLPSNLVENELDRATVQIIKPGKAGPVVETYLVPRHR